MTCSNYRIEEECIRSRRKKKQPIWKTLVQTIYFYSLCCVKVAKLFLVEMEERLKLFKLLMTILAFVSMTSVAVLSLPIVIFAYISKSAFRSLLSWYVWWRESDVIELAHSSQYPAWEGTLFASIKTTVIILEGRLTALQIRPLIAESLLNRKSSKGKLLHPNFKRKLGEFFGMRFWMKYEHFNLEDHVIEAPPYFHKLLVSNKNIQDYVSTLCYRNPMTEDKPPWQMFIVHGVGSNQEITTWLIYRTHPLLGNVNLIPNMNINTHIDPWLANQERTFPLLSAPTATKRLLILLAKKLLPALIYICNSLKKFLSIVGREVLDLVKEVAPDFYRKIYYEIHYVVVERSYIFSLMMVLDVIIRLPSIIVSGFREIRKYTENGQGTVLLKRCVVIIIATFGRQIMVICIFVVLICIRIIIDAARLIEWIARVRIKRTETETILLDAAVEIYWIIRAVISVPRLILEELLETKRSLPLEIWKGYKERSGFRIVWNEGTPVELVTGIQNATGSTFPTVLLTAATGAVRDHLRSTGIKVPRTIRTTLPIYTSSSKGPSSPTLLPLTLPTGELSAPEALKTVKKSLTEIKKYPEKGLISAWILQHYAFILPSPTLKKVASKLTEYYPVLLCYNTVSEDQIDLWGCEVKSLFQLRQPIDEAAISICITSYSGMVIASAIGASWAAPFADRLSKGMDSCLRETAISSGVRLDRREFENKKKSSKKTSPSEILPPPSFHNKKSNVPTYLVDNRYDIEVKPQRTRPQSLSPNQNFEFKFQKYSIHQLSPTEKLRRLEKISSLDEYDASQYRPLSNTFQMQMEYAKKMSEKRKNLNLTNKEFIEITPKYDCNSNVIQST